MDSDKAILGNAIRPTWPSLLLLFTIMLVLSYQISTMTGLPRWAGSVWGRPGTGSVDPWSCSGAAPRRKVVMSITDFGGVGDGTTSNTEAFRKAVLYMQQQQQPGGSQLNVPRGRWLTGSFNLTSNFTLFLQEGAVILGSQVNLPFPFSFPLRKKNKRRD